MSDNFQKPQGTKLTKTSPFKEVEVFEKELKAFANKYKTIISEHASRISDYFEMSCFNMIARYYEYRGYTITVENEQAGRFRFKCSPSGLIENFSYMKLDKNGAIFHLYHNASVQSAHDDEVFTTPDILVAKDVKPAVTTDYYKTKKKFSYLRNSEMITFCEVKNFTPYPELMINFIGTVNELKPTCLQEGTGEEAQADHLAPSLMMSGGFSKPTKKVAHSLQKRYYVNILGDLFFEPYKKTFTMTGVSEMATLGRKKVEENEL